MMYLIRKNDKYLVMASDIDTIIKYCGLDARIIFSWEEENQEESLKSFFSRMRMEKDMIELCEVSGITKKEVYDYIDKYYKEDELILSSLSDIEVISSNEKDELNDISIESKKKQMDLVSECYYFSSIKSNKRR